MGTSIFLRVVMIIIIIPLFAYSSARNNDAETCRKIGIMPACFKIPIAVDEHEGVPGVIVPADYLEQVELAASRNPSFVSLNRIAGKAGNDISHVMLKQEEMDRRVSELHLQMRDMARKHFYCMTGCTAVICWVVYLTKRKNNGL